MHDVADRNDRDAIGKVNNPIITRTDDLNNAKLKDTRVNFISSLPKVL